jgi:hypothetical protein
MKKNLSIAEKIAHSRGGKCLTVQEQARSEPFSWKCKNGHTWTASLNNVLGKPSRKGTWCPFCAGKVKTWQSLEQDAEKVGARPLFQMKDYQGNTKKLDYQCLNCQNKWTATPSSIQTGRGCPNCAWEKRSKKLRQKYHSIEEIRNFSRARGGDCLSPEYLGIDEKHDFICSSNHKWSATAYSIIKQKTWCPVCIGRFDKLEELKATANERGGALISTKYVGTSSKYEFECNLKHRFSKTLFKLRDGQWCPECSGLISERICRYYMQKLFRSDFPKSRPAWLEGLELDGYSEKLKIAFEHQGFHHYQETHQSRKGARLKDWSARDLKKKKLCKENGVKLIAIPELGSKIKTSNLLSFISAWAKKNKLDELICSNAQININEAYIREDEIKKLNIIIKSRGLMCLDTSFIGVDEKYQFKCLKCENIFSSSFYSIKKGGGCQRCLQGKLGSNQKKTLHELETEATKVNLKLDFEYSKYKKNSEKYKYHCTSCDKTCFKTPSSVKSGQGCPFCSIKKLKEQKIKDYLPILQKIANEKDGRCLSPIYLGVDKKHSFECKKGHTWETSAYSIIKVGTWCPICLGRKKNDITLMNELANSKGGTCISKNYINQNTPLKWKCLQCSLIWEQTPKNIKKGKWCPTCSIEKRGKKALKSDEIISKLEKLGFDTDAVGYKDSRSKINVKCKNCHFSWYVKVNNLLNRGKCIHCGRCLKE